MKPSTDTLLDSAATLLQIRRGDAETLERLYRLYHPHLLGIACRYISDIEAARDVEHDAWVMILSSLDSLQDPSKLTAWMTTIVRNTAINYLKRNHPNQHIPLDAIDEPVAEIADDAPLPISLVDIQEMIGDLPQGYEQVFRLNTFEGLSHEQIGERLGISAGSSRSQLARARKILRRRLKQYMALMIALLAILVPLGVKYLIDNKGTGGKVKKELTTQAHMPQQQVPSTESSSPMSTHVSPGQASIMPAVAELVTPPTYTDTVPERIYLTTLDRDVLQPDALKLTPPESTPMHAPQIAPNYHVKQIKPGEIRRQRPNLHFTYGNVNGTSTSVTDNFLSVINLAAGQTQRTLRIYNRDDFFEYVRQNAPLMDTTTARIVTQIADRMVQQPGMGDPGKGDDEKPLSETKHHERPHTLRLSLGVPITPRWSLTSGIGYTWMKSTFYTDYGNGNDYMRRTQRLHYLTIPLGTTFNIWQRNRLSIYASGNLQLDIPLRGREKTEYIYIGPFEPHAPGDSLVFPTTNARINAPWLWSVGAGVGVQYRLLPHVNAFFEPGFRYYIPTGSPVETYRSVHPFELTFPIGIRFVP